MANAVDDLARRLLRFEATLQGARADAELRRDVIRGDLAGAWVDPFEKKVTPPASR